MVLRLEIRFRRRFPIQLSAWVLKLFGLLTGAEYRWLAGGHTGSWKVLATDRVVHGG